MHVHTVLILAKKNPTDTKQKKACMSILFLNNNHNNNNKIFTTLSQPIIQLCDGQTFIFFDPKIKFHSYD